MEVRYLATYSFMEFIGLASNTDGAIETVFDFGPNNCFVKMQDNFESVLKGTSTGLYFGVVSSNGEE